MTRLYRGATWITMDPGWRVIEGDLLVVDGRIEAIGRFEAPAGVPAVDLSGRWVVPGLIQGHVHLGQTLFRGLAEDRRLLKWLEEAIWPLEAVHTDESARVSTLIGGMEAIRAGTTTLLDIGLVTGMEGLFQGLKELRLRSWSGKLLMDRGDGAPAGLVEEPRAALEEGRALAARWNGAEGGRIRYAVCPRFVFSCSPRLWEMAVDQARQGGYVLHTHALETLEEQAAVSALEHRSEFATLEAVGALSLPLRMAHGVWLREEESGRLAAAGGSVMHCPGSNLKLGSGVADIPALRGMGVEVGVGCDGSPCNNFLDPLGEVRLATLLQKWRHGPERFSARDGLALATIGGAKALGADAEIGSLEPGKRADFVVLDLDALHSLMADEVDPYTRIVFGADRTNVEGVYVDGEPIYTEGGFPGLDVPRIMARAREELRDLLKRRGEA